MIETRVQKPTIDLPLILATVFMVVFGLIIIYDASAVAAFRDFGDKLYYFKNQLIWASLGTMSLVFFSFFDYHKLLKLSPLILSVSILLLLAVLIPHVGTKVYGARRWINFQSFTFQPSEITKLALILYGTSIVAKFENFKIRFFDAIIVLFVPLALSTLLVLLEPDLGTAIIFIGIFLSVYFVGGGSIWHFAVSLPAVIAAIVAAIIFEPYRVDRLKSLIDPTHDPQGASYQINQILTALASGGLLGVGLGASRAKFAFIPEIQSDAIFSIVVEELGFVGAVLFVALFLFLITRAVSVAKNASDSSGRILAMGITSLLSIQTLFNLASIVALVPLTGVPLPFISYGGSSLFVTMTSIGILLNIRKRQ